jgi:hypothetical protein
MPQRPPTIPRVRTDFILVALGTGVAMFVGFLPHLTVAVYRVDIASPELAGTGNRLEDAIVRSLVALMGLPRLVASAMAFLNGLAGFPPPDNVGQEDVERVRDAAYLLIGVLAVAYMVIGALIVMAIRG